MLAKLLVQLALARKFEHQEDSLRVVEVSVQAKNVWVSKILLNFDLAPDLFLHLGLDNFGFVEGFEGKNIFWCRLGAYHVNATELAFAKGPAHIEVAQVPLPSGRFTK